MKVRLPGIALVLVMATACGDDEPVVIPMGEELGSDCRSTEENLVCYWTDVGAPPNRVEICDLQVLELGEVIGWSDDCADVTDGVKYVIRDIAFEMIIPAGIYNVATGEGYFYVTAKLYF